jgi:hypothetical protein
MAGHVENMGKIYQKEIELRSRERGEDRISYIFGTKIRERGGLSGNHQTTRGSTNEPIGGDAKYELH